MLFIAKKPDNNSCAWVCPTPNEPITEGTATLTILAVNSEVKKAVSPAAVASQISSGLKVAVTAGAAAGDVTVRYCQARFALSAITLILSASSVQGAESIMLLSPMDVLYANVSPSRLALFYILHNRNFTHWVPLDNGPAPPQR